MNAAATGERAAAWAPRIRTSEPFSTPQTKSHKDTIGFGNVGLAVEKHARPRQPCGLTDPARAQFKALCLKLDESMTDDAIDEVRARIYTCSFFCRLRREVLCRGRERPTPSLHAT